MQHPSASPASALSARPEACHCGFQPSTGSPAVWMRPNPVALHSRGSAHWVALSLLSAWLISLCALARALAAPGPPCGYNSPALRACQRGGSGGRAPSRAHQPRAPAVLIAPALQQAHPVSPLQLKQKARYLCRLARIICRLCHEAFPQEQHLRRPPRLALTPSLLE